MNGKTRQARQGAERLKKKKKKHWEKGRANEGDVAQVWREGRPGRNSGNRAGLIKHTQDRCVRGAKKTGRETDAAKT